MPTQDRRYAISIDEARHRAGLLAFPEPRAGEARGGVGLEPEFFPIVHDAAGRPRGRLLLTQPDGVGVLQVLDRLVETDDRIGHASCEGGVSTGTHLHFARKYNGEWVLADGPLPFVLSSRRLRSSSSDMNALG